VAVGLSISDQVSDFFRISFSLDRVGVDTSSPLSLRALQLSLRGPLPPPLNPPPELFRLGRTGLGGRTYVDPWPLPEVGLPLPPPPVSESFLSYFEDEEADGPDMDERGLPTVPAERPSGISAVGN
jgi:hypothetical protein